MTGLIDLDGWTVLAKRLTGAEYELEAEYVLQPTACLKCGATGRLYKHGTKLTTFRDRPLRGLATRIVARVQRYKCRECGGTFLQELGGIQETMRMTERCADYIKQQGSQESFVRIANTVGCDEKTVRTVCAAGASMPRRAVAAAETRCQSCGGVFDPLGLQTQQAPPFVAGERRKYMHVCGPCAKRFRSAA